ncbi:MAG: hypothetical protein E7604_05850 [Ruminococcaceae bacterium]|nr:hypothetical protein [Oscillospiraceae bacterium]
MPTVQADNNKNRASFHAEHRMLRIIRIASLLCMVLCPLLIDGLLRAVNVYVDTYIAVFYPTTAVTVLQWMLYYLLLILSYVYQCASYGVLGYSVMRYGVRKSSLPIVLILLSATIAYAAGIIEVLYLSGTAAVKNNIVYYAAYWALNYFLSLFTCLCLIFLCAMLRTAYQRRKRGARQNFLHNPGSYATAPQPDGDTRFHVGIVEEDAAARRKNVLRRLYFCMTALLFFFRFVPSITNMISEIRKVGAPGDIWDWVTLLQPFAELFLLTAMGYFVMLHVGSVLTEACASANEEATE